MTSGIRSSNHPLHFVLRQVGYFFEIILLGQLGTSMTIFELADRRIDPYMFAGVSIVPVEMIAWF
jgi:hypothetical protein